MHVIYACQKWMGYMQALGMLTCKHAWDMHAVASTCMYFSNMHVIYMTHIRTYNLCTYQLTLLYNDLIMYR